MLLFPLPPWLFPLPPPLFPPWLFSELEPARAKDAMAGKVKMIGVTKAAFLKTSLLVVRSESDIVILLSHCFRRLETISVEHITQQPYASVNMKMFAE